MSIARHHNEWLSLVPNSGPFLSLPVLTQAFPQGLDALDADHARRLRMAFDEWDDNQLSKRPDPAIHRAWIKLVLGETLGFDELLAEGQAIPQTLKSEVAEYGETLRPDWIVNDPATNKARLLVQVYPRSQSLTKPVASSRWKTSPDTRMMQLLHDTGIRLGIVTNGDHWMFVNAPKNETTGYASWYGNLWLEEPVTLRAFRTLLCADRFFSVPEDETLEALLDESANDQQEVTIQLGYQVRKAVEVLIQALDKADQDHGRKLLADVDEKILYESALTVMMRLVFLFCAEERDLLLLGDDLYDKNYAVSTLREQLRVTADQFGEEILGLRYDAWTRLLSSFRAVYAGAKHDRLKLPAYGGSLFNPDRFPFLEGRLLGTSWKDTEATPLPINNRTVLHLLEALQVLRVRLAGGGAAEARKLSFRSLDIEQIGHVYEGLLDHTAKRATEPMLGLQGTRDKEPEIALTELEMMAAKGEKELLDFLKDATGRSTINPIKKALKAELDDQLVSRFRTACQDFDLWERVKPFAGLVRLDTSDYPVIIATGSVFVTAGTDRRSSGTHYTPKSLTEPIVQYTLEPLVYIGPAEGLPKDQWTLHTAKELLDLKICDMACGSGAFLVQACRYMSARLLEAWDVAERSVVSAESQLRKLSEIIDQSTVESASSIDRRDQQDADWSAPQIIAEKLSSYSRPSLPTKGRLPLITPFGEPSSGQPTEQLVPSDPDERQTYALRIVAQRCLYGVDINPLAAEMAKLSLWLLTLAKDKPFEFLDHAIRCGDSLVGIHNLEQLRKFNLDGKGEDNRLFLHFLDQKIKDAIALRRQITEMQANTVEDVEVQDRMLREANEKIDRLKCAADMLIAAEFTPGSAADKRGARDDAAIKVAVHFNDSDFLTIRREAQTALAGQVTFHWPLEFPEVMVGRGGFDAFVGNPPFMGGKKISGVMGDEYRHYLVHAVAGNCAGNADVCAYFFLRVFALQRSKAMAGLLATNSIAQTDTRKVGLEQLLVLGASITRAIKSRAWPGDATLEVALVWFQKGDWSGACVAEDQLVTAINAFLDPTGNGELVDVATISSNIGKAFLGACVRGIGFVLTPDEATKLLDINPRNRDVIYPYITGEELNSRPDMSAGRFVINFFDWPREKAEQYKEPFEIVRDKVLPERMKIKHEATRTKGVNLFWQYDAHAKGLFGAMQTLSRVFARSKVANTHSVGSMSTSVVPSEQVVVFGYDTFDAFAILQSAVHELWLRTFAGSLRTDTRYSVAACFETFPLPNIMKDTTIVGKRYFEFRSQIMLERKLGLTKTYNRFHISDEVSTDIQKLRELHVEMDNAVAAAYGWTDLDLGHGFHETKQGVRYTISEPARREVLARLLKLNHERHAEEVAQGLHKKKAKATKGKKNSELADIGPTLFGEDE